MISPAVFVLPSWMVLDAEQIQKESRIRGDQVTALGGEAEMLVEIGNRMPEMGAFVLGRLQTKAFEGNLIASFDDDLSAVLSLPQKVQAIAAARLLVTAALHGVMPSDKNQALAKVMQDGRGEAVIGLARLGSALSFIESLESQLQALAARRSGNGAQSIEVRRVDEDARCVEYEEWRRAP